MKQNLSKFLPTITDGTILIITINGREATHETILNYCPEIYQGLFHLLVVDRVETPKEGVYHLHLLTLAQEENENDY